MIKRFLQFLLSLFIKSEEKPIPIPPQTLPTSEFSKRALLIVQRFEGNTSWANITGNFDGAGLTCGALGWTIKWNNQQRLVKAFVAKYGIEKFKSYLPKIHLWYWDLVNIKNEAEAIKEANTVSGGTSKVKEPYNSDLTFFWSSPEMQQIQCEFADLDMGKFAMEQASKFKAKFMLPEISFQHFCYYFDQAVLNGTGKNPDISEGELISLGSVFSWMDNESGYGQKDFERNLFYWKKLILSDMACTPDQILLFKLAKIRADRAREEFDTITMSRRGILALGSGYLNGEFWDLKKELGLNEKS
jgi:hypothetical protein